MGSFKQGVSGDPTTETLSSLKMLKMLGIYPSAFDVPRQGLTSGHMLRDGVHLHHSYSRNMFCLGCVEIFSIESFHDLEMVYFLLLLLAGVCHEMSHFGVGVCAGLCH